MFGGQRCDIVDVHLLVEGIADPDFLLVGREADAVAGATVSFDWSLLEASHFHAMQLLAGHDVTDFKPEQFVHADEAERLSAVHREGANAGAEWSHGAACRV